MTAGGMASLTGTSAWGLAASLTGLNLTSSGDIAVNGQAPGAAWAAGVQMSNSTITSQNGNVSLTGLGNSDPQNTTEAYGLNISSSNITANATSGNIVLNGSSTAKTGLLVTGSTLSGAGMSVLGKSVNSGSGFVFSGTTLQGGLTDLMNVTFSSAGSASGVTNSLDSQMVSDTNRDTLLAKHIENMTRIDMNGTAIFDDTSKTDKGWVKDYTSTDVPNGGWIFNNTSVTAGGDVQLKGVGFTNSAL
ncbi:TPA: hypothetical protein MND73_004813, partial [Salmonella enterica subsp. houtenae]|nr:hypothetical protein [Salmonella enterica subsp. houtenae]